MQRADFFLCTRPGTKLDLVQRYTQPIYAFPVLHHVATTNQIQKSRLIPTVDSTFLTSKFKGQLATTCTMDGHNWMHPIAFGVMDSETNDNQLWFMDSEMLLGLLKGQLYALMQTKG